MKGSFPSRIKPTTVTLVAAVAACGLVGADALWPRQLRYAPVQLNLPADLAKYKEWKAQLQSPEPVPWAFWVQCMAPTPAQRTQAREKHGPHNEHYIQVYANPIATQTLREGKSRPFLTGAVIAKEKLMDSPQGPVSGVAFMIKRSTPQFASTGGWEFAYYPRSGDSASMKACASCHSSTASTDYVFGQYPSSSGRPVASSSGTLSPNGN